MYGLTKTEQLAEERARRRGRAEAAGKACPWCPSRSIEILGLDETGRGHVGCRRCGADWLTRGRLKTSSAAKKKPRRTGLDADARAVTTAGSFADLLHSVRPETGYKPTLRPEGYSGAALEQSALRLRSALHERGVDIYPRFGTYDTEKQTRNATKKRTSKRKL